MEFEEDEAVTTHPKLSKPKNPLHFESISSQDSILPMPNLPTELINNISTKIASLPNTKLRSLFFPQQNSQLQRVLISATQMEPQEDEAFTKPAHISSQDSIMPMPNLPTELITEILLKLPVKSLLKFRSVSKSWLSLISSPDFVKTHLLLSASNKDYTHHGLMFKFASTSDRGIKDCSLSALLCDSVTEAFDLDYPGKYYPNDYPRFVGSVNGLICLAINRFMGLDDLFLWNPSIRKYKKLPSCRLNQSRCYHEQALDGFNFGFAYDEFQDDYKVVGIFPISGKIRLCRIEVQIYSLKSNSWRRIDDFQGRELLNAPAKCVNGKLHWLDKQRNIISIDLADEKWAEVERPYSEGCGYVKLGVFGSDLAVLCNYGRTHVDVWVMTEYGVKESWTKMFTVKFPNDSMGIFYPPILMSNEGEILLKFGSRFTKYNPKDDSIRYVDVTNFAPCIEAEIYVKSLVCPFYRGDHERTNNGG
ncbi:F-box/kelch-repeat protein At3g23880-like isoform X2 [Lycium barbarum]|uniref:F-box/kelch-repeat protein At3g23880-like isoform X2 n=1 Tax=Lycium barbarum TaxID=112863 RepID=UPI00293E4241|nr:F-box/kelch-repeat protein At3g23880-like isoform X2 [Lycium barbarum]